jgi:hypothetical protein
VGQTSRFDRAKSFDGAVYKLAIFSFSLVLAACSREGDGRAPGFANRVWQVTASSGVAPGTLYVFLSEGTLLVASPKGKPALGTWKYEGGGLTMVEEGIPYKTDVLHLSATEFKIRSNNPGQPVEISLVPALSPPMLN